MLVQTADVLDLHLEIDSKDKFKVLFYDKRDKYNFTVQCYSFLPRHSNIPDRMPGVFKHFYISKTLRFSKICNNFDS